MLGIVEQPESAFCVVCTTLVQLGTQCSHCSVYAEIKNKTWNSWEFYCHKNIKNININIICNIIIFIKGDISPDLRDFRFPSPDHQTWTDFTRFGEKSPGVATLDWGRIRPSFGFADVTSRAEMRKHSFRT